MVPVQLDHVAVVEGDAHFVFQLLNPDGLHRASRVANANGAMPE